MHNQISPPIHFHIRRGRSTTGTIVVYNWHLQRLILSLDFNKNHSIRNFVYTLKRCLNGKAFHADRVFILLKIKGQMQRMVCTDRLSVGMFQRHSRFRSQYILQLSGNELHIRCRICQQSRLYILKQLRCCTKIQLNALIIPVHLKYLLICSIPFRSHLQRIGAFRKIFENSRCSGSSLRSLQNSSSCFLLTAVLQRQLKALTLRQSFSCEKRNGNTAVDLFSNRLLFALIAILFYGSCSWFLIFLILCLRFFLRNILYRLFLFFSCFRLRFHILHLHFI